jgi:hypothetical protein
MKVQHKAKIVRDGQSRLSNDLLLGIQPFRNIRFGVVLAAFLVSLGLLIWTPLSSKAAIALNYIFAIPGNQSVTLEWQTAAELNLSGFIVYRSNSANGTYQRLNADLISSKGDALLGDTYSYVDSSLTNGSEYFYRLDLVKLDQSVDSYYPLQVVPGSTATGSAPLTPVVTGQVNTPTRTITPSPNPQATASPAATGSPAPTATPTQSLTPTISPTPLPTLSPTVQVQIINTITPVVTQDISGTATVIAMGVVTEAAQITPLVEETAPTPSRRDWLRIGILVLLGAIWLLLGAWMYYYLTHMQR